MLINAGNKQFKKTKDTVNTQYNKYWWNDQCARATALRRRAKNRMQRNKSQQNILEYRRLHAAAIRIHKLAKILAWKNYVNKITADTTSKEVWQMIRSFGGRRKFTRSPLIQNNTLVHDIQQKAEILVTQYQKTMFDEHIHEYNHEFALIIDKAMRDMELQNKKYNKPFTKHELENAITYLPTDKTCGNDEVHNQFLKNLTEAKKDILLGIYNELWTKGIIPEEWKLGLIIPILKQDKEPTLPSSYRPITLLSCLCKLLEKMICDRLVYHMETDGHISPTQSGYRIRRSTVDPIIGLEHEIRTGIAKSETTVVVFFDLKAAFDSVDHTLLLKTLAQKEIGGTMLKWLNEFLSNRKIQVILENKFSSIKNINRGVPQGSILSPILFIILLSTMPNVLPIVSKELADDIAFSITSDTYDGPGGAISLMQAAINRFSEWCDSMKLKINVQKTKVMVFSTKKYLVPPILRLNGEYIQEVKKYRYLGMTLDAPYLTWGEHFKELKTHCTRTVNILKSLAGTNWGADRETLLKIYQAMIKGKIAYGCPAYISASDTNLGTLEIVQNQALRIALGTWQNTNIAYLQVESNVEPIKLHLQQLSIIQYFKTKSMGPTNKTHDIIFGNEDHRDLHYSDKFKKKPFMLKTEEIMRNWNIPFNIELKEHKYPVIPPWYNINAHISLELKSLTNKSQSKEQNKQAVLETIKEKYKNTLQIYTDGSKATNNSTGAAFYVPGTPDTRSNWRLNDNSCIVSAELSAIHIATSWLVRTDIQSGKVVILTDSKTSLHLIKQRIPKRYIASISKIHENILELTNKNITLTFQWIPSHCDIKGNDKADDLANEGRSLVQTYPIEFHNLKGLIKRRKLQKWQQYWDIHKQNTNYGRLKPNIGNWYWYKNKDRAIEVQITRLRLEKANLNKYLHEIKYSPTPLCRQCYTGQEENTEHYLLHCHKFTLQRNSLKIELRNLNIHNLTLNLLLGESNTDKSTKNKVIKALNRYLKETKRLV